MSNETIKEMILHILNDYYKGYEEKMKMASEIIRKINIKSTEDVAVYMKNILDEFHSNYVAQRNLMLLLRGIQNNDKEALKIVKTHIQQGEPYKQHLKNLLEYQEKQVR